MLIINDLIIFIYIYRTITLGVSLITILIPVYEFIFGKRKNVFYYYTTWSVILAFIISFIEYIAVKIMIANELPYSYSYQAPILKFMSTIMIFATFIVSAFLLPNKIYKKKYWTLKNLLPHFVLPLLIVFDSILFDPYGVYKIYYPYVGVILPIIYWSIISIRVIHINNKYFGNIPKKLHSIYFPYGFIDINDKKQLYKFLLFIFVMLVILIIFGYILIIIKKSP